MTAPEPELLPEPDYSGSTFDRYHLIRRLGVGGMGAVYEAEHTELRKHCAVKMLRHELAQNEMFRRRFLREARAASAVAHPHVVDISDYGETTDGQVYFVMELFQGRELQGLLDSEGRLSWPRTREILLQVTSALEAAHRLGVIHRDIKPSNCFLVDLPGLGDEDFVKVLDFGIAKVSGKLDESTQQLTSTQEIFGTVAYMAPEMAMGTSDEPRSDIYALGVMMYRMLVGELPFAEGNAFQILSQHVHDEPPRPRSKVPSIPEEVEAIILKAMAKKPSERFATMEEFGRALRHGSLTSAGESGLRTAVLGLQPLGPDDSPSIGLDKTTPLPASGVVIDAVQTRAGSGPIPARGSESGSSVLGDEPTMLATPVGSMRIEPTVSLDTPKPIDPTVSLDTPKPIDSTVSLDTSPKLVEATSPSKTSPRRKRSLLWVAVPTLGLVAAVGSFAALYGGSRDDARVLAARDPRPAPTTATAPLEPMTPAATRVPPEAPPPSPASVLPVSAPPSTAPADEPAVDGEGIKPAEPEPTEPNALTSAGAVEPEQRPEPAPPPVEEPKPAAKKTSKPKTPKRSSGSTSDAFMKKKLKAKILDQCRFEMAGKRVTVSFFVTPSGAISLLTASPKNEGAECAKDQVRGAKFSARSQDTPIKIIVN